MGTHCSLHLLTALADSGIIKSPCTQVALHFQGSQWSHLPVLARKRVANSKSIHIHLIKYTASKIQSFTI